MSANLGGSQLGGSAAGGGDPPGGLLERLRRLRKVLIIAAAIGVTTAALAAIQLFTGINLVGPMVNVFRGDHADPPKLSDYNPSQAVDVPSTPPESPTEPNTVKSTDSGTNTPAPPQSSPSGTQHSGGVSKPGDSSAKRDPGAGSAGQQASKKSPSYSIPSPEPAPPYTPSAAESTFTFMIGIPVGRDKGLADPIPLNAWAAAAGLYQYWEVGEDSTLSQTYQGSIAPSGKSAAADPRRPKMELPEVLDAVRKLNGLPATGKIGAGVYKGPFIFGARNTQPAAELAADTDPSVPLSQVSVSVLESAETASKKAHRYCPTEPGFRESLPEEAAAPGVLVTTHGLLHPNRPALQFVQLTNAQWSSFRNTFPSQQVVIGGYPINVRLSQLSAGPRQQLSLASSEVTALKAISARSPSQRPVVIVFDDSWPRNEPTALHHSIQFFCDALHELWKGESPVLREDPDTGEVECTRPMLATMQVPTPRGLTCGPGVDCRTHAEKIRSSLEPFLSEVGSSGIDVVYLPFNAAQDPAWNVLFRLIQWSATSLPPETWPERLQSVAAKGGASNAFNDMIPSVYDGIPKQLDKGLEVAHTNLLLLDSLLIFSRKYSVLSKRPIFLNLSWTFADIRHDLPVGNDGLNLVFAAAGDNCDPSPPNPAEACRTDYKSALRVERFAYDTNPPTRVAAIMDLDSNGAPECRSTRIRAVNLGLGYFGTIDGDCGSSFASPRVAWLFGLYESRSKAQADPDDFGNHMREKIQGDKHCHDPIADDYSCMEFSVSYLDTLIKQEN